MARWCAARSSDSSRSSMLGERTRPSGSMHGLRMARLMMLSTPLDCLRHSVRRLRLSELAAHFALRGGGGAPDDSTEADAQQRLADAIQEQVPRHGMLEFT